MRRSPIHHQGPWKWIHEELNAVLPKSLMGKAIEYCTNLWVSLMHYLENRAYKIDNNAIENIIRPEVSDKKQAL